MDFGYSWVVLSACCCIHMLAFGLLKSYGMLLVKLLTVYNGGAGFTSTVGSVASLVLSFTGVFGCALGERTTFRKVLFFGGIMQSMGIFLSVFVNRLNIMFVTYTLITGIGFGLLISPAATVMNFYFEKHRAIASGFLCSASGVGLFLFQNLYKNLFDEYGLKGCLLLISGIVLNNCVAALLIRQPELLKEKDTHLDPASYQRSPHSVCLDFVQKLLKNCLSLYRNLSFILECSSFTWAQIGYVAHFFLFPPFIKSRGFQESSIVIAMTIFAVAEIICRILWGALTDRVSPAVVYCVTVFVGGFAAIIVSFTNHLWILYGYAAVVGGFPGAVFVFMPPILVRSCGLRNLGSALSLSYLCGAISIAAAVPVLDVQL
ncbi:monocarboxylate transporter 12-like isoform X2 [Ostrea edulis]|uniref:monocarboxylate transporter 12-like isoform X2 n=1 Tax=Ostrea edulis TaxID=37623 RepID=UPI0024AFDCCB|nr:monocarboxylate transporter 12-like isoform X2 [Ostrea edulis]